jgi:hypothetical protein
MDSPENVVAAVMCLGALAAVLHRRKSVKRKAPEPCRTSKLRGAEWVEELLNGHDGRFFEQLRMSKAAFLTLAEILVASGLQPFPLVGVNEQLAILLMLLGHAYSSRDLAERFQHSSSTISLCVGFFLCVAPDPMALLCSA